MRTSSRIKPILDICTGKTVLDIGCSAVEKDGTWLHGEINKVAVRLDGIDIKNTDKPLPIIKQSADELFELGEKYQVVVAAEVIDHICNLGVFTDNIRRHLADNGVAIITAHNPQAFEFFLEQLVYGVAFRKVTNHTHWQSPATIRVLLERHRLKLKLYKYIHFKAGSLIGKLYDVLTFMLPQRYSRSVLYIATRS